MNAALECAEELGVEPQETAAAAALAGRADLYRLLAGLFRSEPTAEDLRALHGAGLLRELVDDPAELAGLADPTEEVVAGLAEDFCKLLLGPGVHVAPMGSVHHPGEVEGARMWGSTTQWLFRFVADHGLKLEGPGYQGIPDQIFVELELCARLVDAEAEAIKTGDAERAQRLRGSLGVLIEQNFLPWLEVFVERVEEFLPSVRGALGRSYLGGLCRFTLDLVRDEARRTAEVL